MVYEAIVMLKNSRQLIIGIVIGVILASTVAFGADIISNSYFNDNLKLAINGNPINDIRIVTVEIEGEQYGRNYYSIADLIKAFNDYGGISAKVDFDAKTQTTVIEVEREVVMIIPTPEPTPTPEPVNSPALEALKEKVKKEQTEVLEPDRTKEDNLDVKTYTDENGIEISEVDGEKYINNKVVNNILSEFFGGSVFAVPNDGNKLRIMDLRIPNVGFDNGSMFAEKSLIPDELSSLELEWFDPQDESEYYIKYNDYNDKILPFIK